MSFAQLLQRAPYYSPAKGSPPRQKRPNEPAPLASLLQAHRIPGRPLVNPYEALSASDFDSFVDSVSGKITSALTYDAKAQASKARGYLDDEEYWLEMGGKPGQFLGGQMQTGNDDEQEAHDKTSNNNNLLDELYDRSDDYAAPEQPKERLYPDLSGLQDERAATNTLPTEGPEEAQPTFHRASSVFDEYLRNLQDGQLETEEQPDEAEAEIEEYQEDEDDLGVLPELSGEASDSMPIDSLLDAPTNDAVEEAMLESEEIIEDIYHDLQAIQQAEAEEEQLDLELEEELGLQHDIDTPAAQSNQGSQAEGRPAPERRSASQVIELDLTSSEEETVEAELEEEEEEEEEAEEEEELPAFVPARPQTGRKTIPQSAMGSTSALKEPIPSQARLLKERTRLRLDNEAKTASGYESDEESEGYPDEEDLKQSTAEEEEEQMLDEDAEDEEAEMREYRKMRRKMKKQSRAIREQDIEDAYFDEESEGEEDDSEDRDRGREDEGQQSRNRNEEEYDTTSSHGTAASDRNKKKWDEEMEDELEDDDVAQQDRAQSGTLDERVPIPSFFKKQKGTNEYELISGDSEEDEGSEERSESASEDVQGEVEESQEEPEIAEETDLAEDGDAQVIDQDSLGEVVEFAIEQALGDVARQAEAVAVAHPDSTIEVDSSIEFIGELVPAGSTSSMPDESTNTATLPPSMITQSATSETQVLEMPQNPGALEAALGASAGVLNDEVTALLNEVLHGVNFPKATLDPNQLLQDPTNFMPLSSSELSTIQPTLPYTTASTFSDPPLPTTLGENQLLQQEIASDNIDNSESFVMEPSSDLPPPQRSPDNGQNIEEIQPLQDVAMTGDEMEISHEVGAEPSTAEIGSIDSAPAMRPGKKTETANDVRERTPSLADEAQSKEDTQFTPSPPPEEESRTLGMDTSGPVLAQEAEEVDERTPSPPPMQDVGITEDEMEVISETQRADPEDQAAVMQTIEELDPVSPVQQSPQNAELDYIPLNNNEEGELVSSTTDMPTGSDLAAHGELTSDVTDAQALMTDETSANVVTQEMAEETTIHPDPIVQQADMTDSGPTPPVDDHPEELSVPLGGDAAVRPSEDEAAAPTEASTREGPDDQEALALVAEQHDEKSAKSPPVDAQLEEQSTEEEGERQEAVQSPAPITEATPTRAFNAIKPGLWDPSTPIRFGGRSLEAAVREAAHDPDRITSLRESMGLDRDDAVKAAESFRSHQRAEQEAMEDQESAEGLDREGQAPDFVPLDPVTHIESDDEEMEDIQELPIDSPPEDSEDSQTGDAVADTLAEETSIHPDPLVHLQEGNVSLESAQYISSDDEHDDSLVAQLLSPRRKSSNKGQPAHQPNSDSFAAFPNSAETEMKRSSSSESAAEKENEAGNPSSPVRSIFKQPAVTPKPGRRRKRTSVVTIPVKDESEESQASDTNATEDLHVQSILTKPSRPRPHRHGRRASSVTRRSADRTLGSAPAPVHPDAEQYRIDSQDPSAPHTSPHQTRSQCTYHKLSIPSQSRHTTPGRRLSSRLAQAAESRSSTHTPSDYIFLVPGCATSDRKDEMKEEGMLDLGEANMEEEGHAVKLSNDDDGEISVEGIPSSIIQSLIRAVGIDIFRKGECEILAPIVRVEGASSKQGTPSEKKRKRESDIGTSPSKRSHVAR